MLRKGGDVSAFEKALEQAVGEMADVSTAQPREGEGNPGPSDAYCQGEEGRCVAH